MFHWVNSILHSGPGDKTQKEETAQFRHCETGNLFLRIGDPDFGPDPGGQVKYSHSVL